MKTIHKTFLFGLLYAIAGLTAVSAQNILSVADFTAAAGKEAWVPIYLENADEVVGAQFDITLPYAKSSSAPALIASRSDGHTVSIRKLSNTRYTVVIMSMQNAALKGSAGLLLRFPVTVSSDAQADDTVPFSLANIVLTARGGHNIATEQTSSATFTVQRLPSPDYVVTELSIAGSEQTLSPGGKLPLQFNVVNQGTGESGAGWTEKIYFEDQTGTRWYLASNTYQNTLPAATTLPRTYEVDIPQVVGTEGTVRAVVEVVQQKNGGELIADQGNNEAVSTNSKTLEKKLSLSSTRIVLTEGAYKNVTLSRSGDRSMDETFTIAEQNDLGITLLTLPATVTIPAGQSGKSFRIKSVDNTDVNDLYRTNVCIYSGSTASGTPDATLIVDVEDNDVYPLTLTTDKDAYTEGESLTLTATIATARTEDLKVNIGNSHAGRFYPYVRSITIPAGQLSASETTQVVDDNYPLVDATVTWTAQADGFATSKATATVTDNDWPTLTLTLSNPLISEGDGYGATMLTITRDGSTAENLTTKVSSNAGLQLYYDSQYNIIPAGQSSVTIPVSVEDNSLVDGERTFTISVAACDASAGKPVSSGHRSFSTIQLTITDDDTDQWLKMQSNKAQLALNGSGATVTLSRNTTSGDCTVALTSTSTWLNFPATVTIPSGSTSKTFTAQAAASVSVEDGQTATIMATCSDYQSAAFTFTLSSLPDAVTGAPQMASAQPFGGQTVDVTIDVTNQGTNTLTPGMNVRFYLSETAKLRYRGGIPDLTQLAYYTLSEAVEPGETVPMTFAVTMPANQMTKQYYLFAWLNYEGNYAESNKGNGLSASTPVYIRPAFTLSSIQTDKTTYEQGATVQLSGQMSNAESGLPMEGKSVDVYLLDAANARRQVTTTLDAGGNFATTYKMPSLTGGTFLAGACVSGTGGTDTGTRFTVSAIAFDGSYLKKIDLTESVAAEGDLKLTNLSPETVHNITLSWTGVPDGWTVELPAQVTSLQSGAQTLVHYRIVPNTPSSLLNGGITATAHDSEGNEVATTTYPTYLSAKASTSKLVTDQANNTIRTTMRRDAERQITVRVGNSGVRETGNIRVNCSADQQWLSASTTSLASLANGESTEVTLTLAGEADMLVDGTYEAKVRFAPENSAAVDLTVKATVVGTDLATLTVDVVDAYSLAEEGGPHVSGASVRLTNNLTGEVTMTGTTGSDGCFTTDRLKEGTYDVYVTAPNHYYAQKTITVAPGQENEVQMFLNYEAVKMTYTVERTTVVDRYETILTMDIVPDIPQAIVVPCLPSSWGTGRQTHSIRLTNKGRLTAFEPYLEFPNVDGVTFTVLSDYPSVIYPNESYDVTVQFEGPEDAEETRLGYIRMHYGYRLTDGMHYGSETYAATMGYGDMVFLPSGGLPDVGSNAKDRNYGSYSPPPKTKGDGGDFFFGGDDDPGGADEPEIQIRDYTKSVDNRVRLQFKQSFLLEREAFKGSLTVENQQMNSIEHVTLIPNVKRTDGTDATDLFAVSYEGEDAWKGSDNWTLASSGTGKATVLYVPSKETAPTAPVEYLFGGTVSYRDVETGNLITVELTPTKLAVNPSPDLHLTYFVQRDFISDDPVTDEVEPWEPTQFALLIQNKGAGPALDLKIETSDPNVVENLNNLPVKFTKLYSTVDGVQGNQEFNKLNLGRIEGGQNVMARWWYYCNVSAHVANYMVQMTKASNYGEEFNLITVDGVRELTRSVCGSLIHGQASGARRRARGADNINASTNIFLLNTIADEDNLPDYVTDETGEGTDDLEIASQHITLSETGEAGVYTLRVTASREGWVYGVVHDPTNCGMKLTRVTRGSDGADLTANFWQTDRTVLQDNTVMPDNRLHLADNIGTEETYTLYYVADQTVPGDANGDGNVSITDVSMMIDHILGLDPADMDTSAADMDGNGSITINDVGMVIDLILAKEGAGVKEHKALDEQLQRLEAE